MVFVLPHVGIFGFYPGGQGRPRRGAVRCAGKRLRARHSKIRQIIAVEAILAVTEGCVIFQYVQQQGLIQPHTVANQKDVIFRLFHDGLVYADLLGDLGAEMIGGNVGFNKEISSSRNDKIIPLQRYAVVLRQNGKFRFLGVGVQLCGDLARGFPHHDLIRRALIVLDQRQIQLGTLQDLLLDVFGSTLAVIVILVRINDRKF